MLEWSDVDLAVRDAVREFVDKEIRPHVDALESGEMEPYPIVRKLFATFGIADMARDSLNKRLARLSGGAEPSGGMFGGGGAQAGMGFVVVSELCRVCMGVVTGMGVSLGLTVPTIMGRGTLAQQERWLPDLVTYDKVGAWAITEPDSGSDAFGGMKSYVVRDGDDYILNGQKTFITNGPDADVVVVYAKLDERDGAEKRDRKVLTFVLDRGMDGFVQSKPFRKMGIHSSRTGELFFNNVRLGRDRLLGETEGDGADAASDGRASARFEFLGRAHRGGRDGAGRHRRMLAAVCRLREEPPAVGPGDRAVPADTAEAGQHGNRPNERAQHAVSGDRGDADGHPDFIGGGLGDQVVLLAGGDGCRDGCRAVVRR
jgi:alkylation response protein AidB-like acyl-CoA dehydrogenase